MPEPQRDRPRIRFMSVDQPISTKTLIGHPDEPLVIEEMRTGNRVERRRIVNPERSYQVPTFVFWNETLTPTQQQLVREAINELFQEIGFDRNMIQFLGNWREEKYRDANGQLTPHKSIEWQVKSKRNPNKKQINASDLLYAMFNDPYQIRTPHWEIVITNEDMYTPDTNFVIGLAQDDLGTVISLKRLEAITNPQARREVQKTEVYHEVSHVLGLPTGRRGRNNLEHSLGPHCKSPGCSMKQGLSVPNDWITFTTERLRQGGKPLCKECLE